MDTYHSWLERILGGYSSFWKSLGLLMEVTTTVGIGLKNFVAFFTEYKLSKKIYYLLRPIPYPISKKSTLSMYKSLSWKKYCQASYYSKLEKFFLLIQLAGPGLSKDASDSFFEPLRYLYLVKVLLQEIPQYKHIFL